MKKNLLMFFMSLTLVTTLAAQITVTSAIYPTTGDVLRTRQATSITSASVTTAGPNQTWDFSSMIGGSLDTFQVIAASAGQAGALFPTADVVLRTSIFLGDSYIRNNANSMEIMGFSGDVLGVGVVIPAIFDNPFTLIETPLSYLDTFEDSCHFVVKLKATNYPDLVTYLNDSLGLAGTGIVIDSIRVTYGARTINEADAWGNLTVPEVGAFDVLRVKQTINSNIGVEFRGTFANIPFAWTDPASIPNFPAVPFIGASTSVNYLFYSNTEKETIAVIEMSQTDPNAISEVTYKSAPTSAVFGFANTGTLPSVKAYPNPVIENLTLQMRDFESGNYQVKIYNIVGRELKSEMHYIDGDKNISMDVSDLKKGTYLYRVLNANGDTITTKRIMIVRP